MHDLAHPHPQRRERPPAWDPRVTVLASLAYVVWVVATPLGTWWMLGLQLVVPVVAIVALRVPPVWLLRRWAGIVAFLAVLVGMLAAGHPARGEMGYGAVLAALVSRSSLAVLGILVLGAVEPLGRLLQALRGLGMPPVMVATLHFMYRYTHVLGEERDRMNLARRSRTFRPAGPRDWLALGGLIGGLLLRALERGERVLAAMKARGWDGSLNGLQGKDG